MATWEENKAKIKRLVTEILEIDPDVLQDNDRFKDDHNADSLRAIEILAKIEKDFRIQIPQAELAHMGTLAGIYEVVKRNAGWE